MVNLILRLVSTKVMVGVIYRSPNSQVSNWQTLENYTQPIVDTNIPIFLGGDLNFDMLINSSGQLGDILSIFNLENVVF